jgi:hypothetical protein
VFREEVLPLLQSQPLLWPASDGNSTTTGTSSSTTTTGSSSSNTTTANDTAAAEKFLWERFRQVRTHTPSHTPHHTRAFP